MGGGGRQREVPGWSGVRTQGGLGRPGVVGGVRNVLTFCMAVSQKCPSTPPLPIQMNIAEIVFSGTKSRGRNRLRKLPAGYLKKVTHLRWGDLGRPRGGPKERCRVGKFRRAVSGRCETVGSCVKGRWDGPRRGGAGFGAVGVGLPYRAV